MKINRILLLIALCYASAARGQTVDFTWSTTSGTFCAPQKVTFTQNCSPVPGGFIWTFGNGQTNVHASDTALYLSPGTYTVKLIGLYLDTAITKTKTITINPVPAVSLSSDVISICRPGNITFTAASSPALSTCIWNFADGSAAQTTSSNTVTHYFNNFGDYHVAVTGITQFGCSSTDSLWVSVKQFEITGDINPTEGCIPINAFLSVQTTIPAGDAVQSYVWNYGDGTSPFTNTQSNVIHNYNITTPVTPHITVTSVNGCISQYDFATVAYGIPPLNIQAGTVSGLDTFCGSKIIDLHASAQLADAYLWDYGELITAVIPDELTTYHYSDTGTYHLIVTPMFHGCPGQNAEFDVYIKGVIAKFNISNTCTDKNTFTFTNNSSGHISHYEWTYSTAPGIIDSTHIMPTVTFPPSGTFTTQLTLVDSLTGCYDTAMRKIYTAQPVFTGNKPSVCKDSLIEYHVTNTYPAESNYGYVFHVDGDNVDNFADSNLVRTVLNHGIFNDYVVINHNNPALCKDTLYLSHPTKVTGPVMDFNY